MKNLIAIIDWFEVFTEKSASLEPRSATYSQYNTFKILTACSPTGAITLVSKVGRFLDKEITQKSGFLYYISFRDMVMADRGFNIFDNLAIPGAQLAIPASTHGKNSC